MTPQPNYAFIEALDTTLGNNVAKCTIFQVSDSGASKLPGVISLCLPLEIIDLRMKRLLFIQAGNSTERTEALISADNALQKAFELIQEQSLKVIVSEWESEEPGARSIYYEVEPAELIRAYHLK